jgi:chloride channel protein, CIC family
VDEVMERLGRASRAEFPVVDADGRLVGMASVAELARAARELGRLGPALIASDLAEPTETVAPADTLLEAVRRMGVRGVGTLPVVDPGTERLLGTVDRGEILAAYARAVGAAERA